MDVVGVALSGLSASSAGLAMQANNVANQQSDGFQAKHVDLVAEASGGVRVSGANTDPTPAGPGTSNVDPTAEIVMGLGFDVMYRANLQVLNTANELMKTTLDMKA